MSDLDVGMFVHPIGPRIDESGSGEWHDLDCGCRYCIGYSGWLYAVVCGDHEPPETRELALEVIDNE